MVPETDALEAQCREVDALLSSLGPRDLSRPTRCSPLTVGQLVAHLGRGFHRTADSLAEHTTDPPVTDRFGWWDYGDPAEVSQRVVRTSTQAADEHGDDLLGWWRDAVTRLVTAGSSIQQDRVVRRDRPIRAGDLIATRVVEAAVHGMDLGHATLQGERVCPEAMRVVLDILRTRLGADLPPHLGWAEGTFILTATGRRSLNPAERWTLGPLADRFPLIS